MFFDVWLGQFNKSNHHYREHTVCRSGHYTQGFPDIHPLTLITLFGEGGG